MNKQIALAYGVAGLSAAIAAITVVGATTGYSEPAHAEPPAPAPQVVATTEAEAAVAQGQVTASWQVPATSAAPDAPTVEEVIYCANHCC